MLNEDQYNDMFGTWTNIERLHMKKNWYDDHTSIKKVWHQESQSGY